jgi:hypothetical protein
VHRPYDDDEIKNQFFLILVYIQSLGKVAEDSDERRSQVLKADYISNVAIHGAICGGCVSS